MDSKSLLNRVLGHLTFCLLVTASSAFAQTVDRMFVVAPGMGARSVAGPTPYERVHDPKLPAWNVAGWEAYDRLWKEFAANPSDPSLRRYLGLPLGKAGNDSTTLKIARGRSAPRWLGWKAGSYRQIETPHFRIYSRVDDDSDRGVACDLERVYWIWTQAFFPFWDSQAQVALHLKEIARDQPVAGQIPAGARLAPRKKLRVVLFRDAAEYQRTLAQSVPGIERSTGYYSDQELTSFFYPTDTPDSIATRRHELVHQLFREATRGSLGKRSPGMDSGFWLVEGIAGYFESMVIQRDRVSLGGWDSPRLQFARYRMLAGADRMPLDELFAEGQRQAQRRKDLARWYAHSIARTHQFLDGSHPGHRRWVYSQLSELYALRVDVPGGEAPTDNDRELVGFLRVDDALVKASPPRRDLVELCLTGCEVTDSGLNSMGALDELRWLDLSRLPIGNESVGQLCPHPTSLDRLSLEATRVDDGLRNWLSRANGLTELDLSWTRCGDATAGVFGQELDTLWLTGSAISDQAIPDLLKLSSVEAIDVQRTKVTPQGLTKMKRAKPQWNINPLQLRVAAPAN